MAEQQPYYLKGICWGHVVVTGGVPVVLKPVRLRLL